MTLTLKNVPEQLIDALQKRAAQEGRSLEHIALEAMARGLHVVEGCRKRDLSKFVGSWVEDPEFDEAMKDFELPHIYRA
jgi:plasmid stability protein